MDVVNAAGMSVYLKTETADLFARLKDQKDHRPLIAGKTDDELIDFIMKKVSERESFYYQAKLIFHTGEKEGAEQLAEVLKSCM